MKLKLLIVFIVISQGCDLKTTQSDPNDNLIRDKDGKIIEGEYTQYFDDGKVAAVMHFKNKKLDGKAVKYYKDGITKRSELNYTAGKLAGIQKRYYKSGALYKEEIYVDDKRNGITKKYRESGKLMSESTFKNGFAGANLREYLTNGKLKKRYPEIVIEANDQIKLNGTYTLKIFLSDKTKNVEFYIGKLDEGIYLNDHLDQQYNINDGILTYKYHLRPGEFISYDIHIIAKVITRLNNVYVTTKKYPLRIEYPLFQ
jgi:MORN repeat protein